jgi:hypothetical protein
MRTGRAKLLMALLAVQTLAAFADGTVSPPDPVGEALWRQRLLPQLVPLAIMVFAGLLFFALWLVGRIHRKHEHAGQDSGLRW